MHVVIVTAVRGFNPLPSLHPLLQVLREDEFGPGLVGGKSANLATLRSKLPQGCALLACSPLLGCICRAGAVASSVRQRQSCRSCKFADATSAA